MKKSKIFFVILFAGFLWSCSDDIYDRLQNNRTEQYAHFGIAEARAWYEANAPVALTGTVFKSPGSDGAGGDEINFSKLKKNLNWDKADLSNDSLWNVVELPWEYEDGWKSISYEEVKDHFEGIAEQIPQVLRLVIMQNKQNGNTYGFQMAVLPSLDYVLTRIDSLQTNTYLKRDNGLGGGVLFYSLEENFVNGWLYQNGEIVGKVTKKTENNSNGNNGNPNGNNGNQNGNNGNGNSGSPIFRTIAPSELSIYTCWYQRVTTSSSDSGWYLICELVGSGGSSGGDDGVDDSGGYTPPPDGGNTGTTGGGSGGTSGTGPNAGPKLLYTATATQKDSMDCLPTIMDYLNKNKCGDSRDMYQDVIDFFIDFLGIDISEEGTQKRRIVAILNRYFNIVYATSSNWQFMIDNGNPVYVNIDAGDGSGDMHSVVIIGYTVTGKPRWMDPGTGQIVTGDVNNIIWDYSFDILGCKDPWGWD